jgi:hypothetical protein
VEIAAVTWPPPRPTEPSIEGRPWDPRLSEEPNLYKESKRLVYVVVDEIIEGWVGLSVAPWPQADEKGRLRFPTNGGPIEVGTPLKALERFLAPARRKSRPSRTEGNGQQADASEDQDSRVRIGKTFAARTKSSNAGPLLKRLRDHAAHGEVRIDKLNTIFTRPVDLTDKGRMLARLASYGAVLSKLPSEAEKKWRLTKEIEE